MSPGNDVPQQQSAEIDRSILSARDGSGSALGWLLDHYRPYLLQIVNQDLSSQLAAKLGASDLVQDTCLQAARDFPQFAGGSEPELRAWLRKILVNNLHDAQKHFARQKSDLARETPMQHGDQSGGVTPPIAPNRSPSGVVMSAEQMAAVQAAMERLSSDHRQVIELRNLEEQSFEQIGVQLNRSADAARKLWSRALDALFDELDHHPDLDASDLRN